MIAVDHPVGPGLELRTMAGDAGRSRKAHGAQEVATGDVSQCDDDLQTGQGGEPGRQERPAGGLLRGFWPVAGRSAAHSVGDHAIDKDEAITRIGAVSTLSESGLQKRLEKQNPGMVARKRTPGPVGAGSSRRQPKDKKPRRPIAE